MIESTPYTLLNATIEAKDQYNRAQKDQHLNQNAIQPRRRWSHKEKNLETIQLQGETNNLKYDVE